MLKRRFLEIRQAGLLRKHPDLATLRWRSCPLIEAPLADIGRIIQNAWSRAYGSRIRIAYGPELLHLAAISSEHPGIVTFAEDDNGLCGMLLGLPTDWETDKIHGPVTLSTGLSTTDRWEGNGLAEILLIRHQLNLMDAGHKFQFHWRATESGKELQENGLIHAKMVLLYAKPLRCATAVRLGNLPWWQGLGMYWLAWRHSPGRWLPRGLECQAFDPVNAADCAQFLERYQPTNAVRRRFGAETLLRRCVFEENGIRGIGLVFRDGGDISGMVWGYLNPVNDTNAYFAMDGVIFHADLPPERRAACLSAMEGYVRDQLGCFAVMVPGSVCREPLDRLGYIAVRKYHVGALAYEDLPFLTRENVGNAFLELR